MNVSESRYRTTPIEAADVACPFSCGVRALDDYFARHALPNDAAGIGRAYVMRRAESDAVELPAVLGFYTLCMANVESALVAPLLQAKVPRYPLPVALIGRLAVDTRAQGHRFGEALLLDALRRTLEVSSILGCLGVIVDAKDEQAEGFYGAYDFVALTAAGSWPRRMYLPIAVVRAALLDP